MEKGRKRLALHPSRTPAQCAAHCDHRRCRLFLQASASWAFVAGAKFPLLFSSSLFKRVVSS